MWFVRPSALSVPVAEALHGHRNLPRGIPSVPALVEIMELWDLIRLKPVWADLNDTITWRLMANGAYSAKSAYEAFFFGRELHTGCKGALVVRRSALPQASYVVCDERQIVDGRQVEQAWDAAPYCLPSLLGG